MSLLTSDKFKEIGILKTLGLNDNKVAKIFLTQSLIISFIGLVFGIGFGYFVNQFFNTKFLHHYRYIPLIELPTNFFNIYSVVTIIGIFLFTLIGSYLPLRKVKRLRIIEVIKE